MNNEQTQAEKLADGILDRMGDWTDPTNDSAAVVGFSIRTEVFRKIVSEAINQATAELLAENERLKDHCRELQWMAKRYAEGRQTFAPSTVNRITRQLLEMGVELTLGAEKTPWARDGGGRKFSGLSDEEWNQGEPMDAWSQIAYADDFKSLRAEVERLTDAAKGSHVLVKIAQEGREKAEAQVAALREQLIMLIPLNTKDAKLPDETILSHLINKGTAEKLLVALVNTQATADAHDAKVREAAIRECLTIIDKHAKNGNMNWQLQHILSEDFQPLLPNQQGEGK